MEVKAMRQWSGTQLELFGAPPARTSLSAPERLKAVELLTAMLMEALSGRAKRGGSQREVSNDKDHR
jgi:hypothetical protein